jgi:glycosyltransferase involved in cell wall biosynthesis
VRILYTAIDQVVPGTLGGSTHVQAVAEGLAALGHELHVAVRAGIADSAMHPGSRPGSQPGSEPGADPGRIAIPAYYDVRTPLASPNLRLLRRGRLRALAAAIRPDVVIERYHNFGGEGLLAAGAVGARTVLEVNAPVIDYPGSAKRLVDRLLIAEPMRRWREWQCRAADLIVTTDRAILPAGTPAAKIMETDWGADTVRFRPGAAGPIPFVRQPGELIAVFAGAFRAWHGVGRLLDAMAALERRGAPWRAVLIGDGPERSALEARVAAERLTRVRFTGSLPYAAMPAALAAADVGVAPFAPEAHAPLRHGFYWSPLKVFEYMASGLPVVAPSLPRLRAILGAGGVGDGDGAADATSDAGVLYDGGDPGGLAAALAALIDDDRRRRLGAAARARAERHYSWAAHCRELEAAIAAMRAAPRSHTGAAASGDVP